MYCLECGERINPARIRAGLRTCINCTTESKDVCFLAYDHKTAPTLIRVPQNKESLRQAKRANRRAR